MKGVVLKHDSSDTQQDEEVGSAVTTVLANPHVSVIPGTLCAAMFSDVVKYALNISALVVFWKMMAGRQDINISLITYLWLCAVVIDTLVKEISFTIANIAVREQDTTWSDLNTVLARLFPGYAEDVLKVNDFWRVANMLMSLSTVVSTICLFFRYSSILQAIVVHLNTSTALFDLYYNSEQPFKMPAGSLAIDIFLFTIFILFACNGAVFNLLYKCCHCFFSPYIGREKSIWEQPNPLADKIHESRYIKRSSGAMYTDIISFETLLFPVFVIVVRFIYNADHVEFFHQLLWKTPMFYYVSTLIAGPCLSCVSVCWCFAMCTGNNNEKKLRAVPPLCIKFILIMVGAVIFMNHRESDPLWAIQVFIGTLILEKVLTLVIALGRAILSILNDKQDIVE